MQPTMEILAKIEQNSNKNKDEVFTRLYRYLLRPDLYFIAYKKLYKNNGASTKGVNDDTADGFSTAKIEKIIKSLADESYTPHPARRTYIKKANGKMRPLGIPTFTDKLVQEVLRMVLEAVYEPIFLECSHGFRPNKGCHTALKDLKHQFHGTRWFVEGDIKGCFDNIDHSVLVGIIGGKIKDARLIKLIYKFLKAGYMEEWRYNNTYSGTPQGGIISPLLANIYLHELDRFVIRLKSEFDRPSLQHRTPEYNKLKSRGWKLQQKIKTATDNERPLLLEKWKANKAEMMSVPCKSQTDKVIKYIRYADDFLIGINGSKEDCQEVKNRLADFIGNTLKMELSEEKTLITHSNQYARFLGYDVRVRRSDVIKRSSAGFTKRTLSNMTELAIPLDDKIRKFLFDNDIVEQANGELKPIRRKSLLILTDFEIVSTYNAELRGICNYYHMAGNFNQLSYFAYFMEYSCLKTLVAKHKSSIRKFVAKHKDGHGKWGIPYETKQGKKFLHFAKYLDSKKVKNPTDRVANAAIINKTAVTTFESRLAAKVCELCNTSESEHYEVHHVNKLKNLNGKKPWEIVMIAKRRKTLVVCRECHHKIHNQ
ncbi:MAG: reverse transcriptase domain-containing protein [Defluviitaleaceae bacterium]|nr:reverse transcriptase domain-containing protein [Defluviitaleaceae bacterium]